MLQQDISIAGERKIKPSRNINIKCKVPVVQNQRGMCLIRLTSLQCRYVERYYLSMEEEAAAQQNVNSTLNDEDERVELLFRKYRGHSGQFQP